MLADWLRRFQKLRVDRASKTPAPHKPLLLLTILDFVESGDISTPQVRLTPELAFRFLGYWEIVGARGRSVGRVELPFFHLQSDGILRHVAHDGLEAALGSIRPTSVELLNRVINYAELPEDLFALMSDRRSRDAMRRTLIDGNWFLPDEQVKLYTILGIEGNPSIQLDDQASSWAATGVLPRARYSLSTSDRAVIWLLMPAMWSEDASAIWNYLGGGCSHPSILPEQE